MGIDNQKEDALRRNIDESDNNVDNKHFQEELETESNDFIAQVEKYMGYGSESTSVFEAMCDTADECGVTPMEVLELAHIPEFDSIHSPGGSLRGLDFTSPEIRSKVEGGELLTEFEAYQLYYYNDQQPIPSRLVEGGMSIGDMLKKHREGQEGRVIQGPYMLNPDAGKKQNLPHILDPNEDPEDRIQLL